MYGSSECVDWLVDVYVGGRLAAEGVWADGGDLPPHTPLPLCKSVGIGDAVELRRGYRVVRRLRVVELRGGKGAECQHLITAVIQ